MKRSHLACALAALIGLAGPVMASSHSDFDDVTDDAGSASRPFLQCVPYARQVTGIDIHGDAHTWWGQAEGRYARGSRPKVGAVMNFRPFGNSHLGHVAAVSRIVDSRTVLIRHANWSPIDGRRGQIEDNVRAVDVSPDNDWSEVRVWFAPIKGLGTTHWPLYGFIYNERPGKRDRDEVHLATRTEGRSDDPIGDIIARHLR
jgi:surface antigen